MWRRRVGFGFLVLVSMTIMLVMISKALLPGGFGIVDVVALLSALLILPWLTIGFWNALIGLCIDLFSRNPLRVVYRAAADVSIDHPIESSTAVLLCVRNEQPARLVRNIETLGSGLIAAAEAHAFHIYVLSDTSDDFIAAEEAQAFEQLRQQWAGQLILTYRRRSNNEGFKAGNIKDFCERWGDAHDFALVLDADSLMGASAVRRLVLMMQADPRLGILQGLVVGLPATSAFTRLFQFGMRLGMRSFTLGSAWWQGDCGPYWGHNAVIRLAAFKAHCDLPVWKDRRGRLQHVLSHDQLEAVLMRRAGYEVRVYPLEDESFEENPPNLIDFVARDLRWCAGNMQYWRFLTLPGLKLTSRIQLLLAMFMFLGAPAWLVLLGCIGWLGHQSLSGSLTLQWQWLGYVIYATALMAFLPKLAASIGVLMRPTSRSRFGGAFRFMFSLCIEFVFSALITSILWVSQTVLLAGLPFGKRISWGAQNRDEQSISWSTAIRAFGLHLLVGLCFAGLWLGASGAMWLVVFYFIGGMLLAIPLAVLTSKRSVGAFFSRWRLAAIAEEFDPPAVLRPCAPASKSYVPQKLDQIQNGPLGTPSTDASLQSGQ
jgi:membrane glycosyltransferase